MTTFTDTPKCLYCGRTVPARRRATSDFCTRECEKRQANADRFSAAFERDHMAEQAEQARLDELRMAWTIGACYGAETLLEADELRQLSLTMSANACLGLTEDGQESRT